MADTIPFGAGSPTTIPFGGGTTALQSPSESIWHQIGTQFNSAAKSVYEGANEIGAGESPLKGLESGLKVESGIASGVTAPLAPVLQPISKAIGAGIDKVSNLPAVQKAASALPNLPYERIGQDLGYVGNIAGTIAMAKTPEATSNLVKSLPKPEPTTPTPVAKAATPSVAPQIQKVAQDWARPTTVNASIYNKARIALSNQPDTPTFLAKQGLSPFSHIEDGKYSTTDSAQMLRDTAGKMSADTLRPSLQAADPQVPPTPVSDVTSAALRQLQNVPKLTPTDRLAIEKNIRSFTADLESNYKDGMKLSDMHDEKINYASNGGYNQFKSNADTNAAIANRAIGSALANLVEAKAPPELPVADFNAYLSKYYKAADYLDALDGKKAPVTAPQAIARGVAKFGGAAIARNILPFGGELVSSFAGYQLGKAVEHAIENMTNPMRDSFLKNLQITNPDAFTKVQQFLQNASTPK